MEYAPLKKGKKRRVEEKKTVTTEKKSKTLDPKNPSAH